MKFFRKLSDGMVHFTTTVNTWHNRMLFYTFCALNTAIGFTTLTYPNNLLPGREIIGLMGIIAGGSGLLLARHIFRKPRVVGILLSVSILLRPLFFIVRYLMDYDITLQETLVGVFAWTMFWIVFMLYWTFFAQPYSDYRLEAMRLYNDKGSNLSGMTNEVRIYVFDQFQYSVIVPHYEPIDNTARKAQEAMRLNHLVPHFAPGCINFLRDERDEPQKPLDKLPGVRHT